MNDTSHHLHHFAGAPDYAVFAHLSAAHLHPHPGAATAVRDPAQSRLNVERLHAVAHADDPQDFPVHPHAGHTCLPGPLCAFWYGYGTGTIDCGHDSCTALIHARCDACRDGSIYALACPRHGETWHAAYISGSDAQLGCGCITDANGELV